MAKPATGAAPVIAQCPCGTCRVELSQMPSERFYCHCSICQSVYPGDYADATIMRASHVKLVTPEAVKFAEMKPSSGLARGLCRSCNHPVIAFMEMPLMPKLAFVPTAVLPADTPKPAPLRHIFYATRRADVADSLPKTKGERMSMVMLTPALMRVALKG